MSEFLEAALAYAELGIEVFPVEPGNKKPPLTKNGVKDASKDPAVIKIWWTKYPRANIGLAMGKRSGCIGIDGDFDDGLDPEIEKKLPPTVTSRSPTAGYKNFHKFYKYPEKGIKNGKRLAKGLTVRADGYYIIGAPSIHPDSKLPYKLEGKGFYAGMEEAPEWMINGEEYKEKKEETREGARHQTLNTLAAHLRKLGKKENEILEELKKLNETFIDGPKPEEEVLKILKWTMENVAEEPKTKKLGKKGPSQEEIETLGKEILDCRFKLHRDDEATILYNIKNINKKEVAVCTNEEVLLSRLRQNILEKTGKTPDISFVNTVYSVWRLAAEPLKSQPKSFTWGDEDEWSFKKLNFIPIEGEYEAWWEFLRRLSCKEDFMAFVWSIFEPKNTSRQFLWLSDLHGEGGKSTIINVLADVFGDSFEAINNTSTGQGARWLMGQLYGKRLVAWADCKNPQFCMSETVRNITSGDPVSVEMKGQPIFTTRMYLKFIVGSNSEPSITGAGADTSRLIHLKLEQGPVKDDPTWASRLKTELPQFLWACREVYKVKCPHHGKINLSDTTKEHVEDASGGIEAKFEEIMQARLIIGEGLTTTVKQFHEMCEEEKLKDSFEIGNFKAFLRRRGVTLKRPAGNKPRVYFGMNITLRSTLSGF